MLLKPPSTGTWEELAGNLAEAICRAPAEARAGLIAPGLARLHRNACSA
jgi:hypothetical protein